VSLRLYDTLTRQKTAFVPRVPGEARMYVCGITPYDHAHVGHARSAVVFDVIRRHLAASGYRVTVVKNYTDVEDKIIRRAAEVGESPRVLADRFIAAYREDMAALGVLPPDVEPLATAHIEPAPGKPYRMVTLIERLVAAGVAYAVEGDVYFEVRRFPAYGRLSGRNLDELLAGARVEVDERKRDPRDFALWKAAKPGEPAWPSPWGPGRPGWHIECSAMAMEYLGESIDLHGGGADLVFPHHECEIAQSEAATGRPFARYWLHNGFVNLGAEKMSKSLGNTLAIRDLVRRHDPTAVRLYLLSAHYRGPIEYAPERIQEAQAAVARLRRLLEEGAADSGGSVLPAPVAEFREAMDDDINTPRALGALFDVARLARRGAEAGAAVATVRQLGERLGLDLGPRPGAEPETRVAEIESLVAQRDRARQTRDWARADALRQALEAQGVVVEDTPAGSKWRLRPAP
jgi:cysteinyl-tRNA synthetase